MSLTDLDYKRLMSLLREKGTELFFQYRGSLRAELPASGPTACGSKPVITVPCAVK